MGIGKGKSDKIDIDGLICSVNNENKATQETSSLAEKVAELEQTTKALNTVIDRADCIITCLLYTSPSPRDTERSRMPSSA